MKQIQINKQRLLRYIEEMAQIGATEKGGCNRQALTELDKQGRALFIKWCTAIGGQARLDSMGNLFIRFKGRQVGIPPILLGSHLDTQPTGGKYDGVYGVLAALEVMHSLYEQRLQLEHSVELVVWCNEEGARFAPAMMGSGVFTGELQQELLYQSLDDAGISFYQALQESEQLGELPCSAFPFSAALELHIEQGPILENKGIPIGLVTGVQGMNWYQISLFGQSVHAGPTPMSMRDDPIQTLASLLPQLYAMVAEFGEQARLTIGRVQTLPSATNTVPHTVIFSVDIRHPEQAQLDLMAQRLMEICGQSTSAQIETLWESPAVHFSPLCRDAIEKACVDSEIDYLPIVSGAGHDSVYLSKVGPTGMIFVPCREGISHNELEFVEPELLETGCNILLQSLLNLTTAKPRLELVS